MILKSTATIMQGFRVVTALQRLPVPEDALVFLDGKQLFLQLQEIPNLITRVSQGQPDTMRVSGLLSEYINQCSVIDHEISVQYTDGFQQRNATFGQLTENLRDKVVGRMAADQESFQNWASFVPENTVGFSVNNGCNLLPLYDWLMKEIPARFPEVNPALEQFAAFQNQHDVHLREDILQSFSGEFVSISLPGPVTMLGKQSDVVFMLRCSQPEHVEELMHLGINAQAEMPAIAQEVLGLLPSVGCIIGKLDFYDATMGMCQPGPEPNSYIRNTVTLITQPAPPKADNAAEKN